MASDGGLLLIYRPRGDERLSWPGQKKIGLREGLVIVGIKLQGVIRTKVKSKGRLICIALYYELFVSVAQVWHVLTRDHTVLRDTYIYIHNCNEPYLPLLAAV